jgi:hypothetical protein
MGPTPGTESRRRHTALARTLAANGSGKRCPELLVKLVKLCLGLVDFNGRGQPHANSWVLPLPVPPTTAIALDDLPAELTSARSASTWPAWSSNSAPRSRTARNESASLARCQILLAEGAADRCRGVPDRSRPCARLWSRSSPRARHRCNARPTPTPRPHRTRARIGLAAPGRRRSRPSSTS